MIIRKRDIKLMQRALKVLGYNIVVDGIYGKGTRRELKKFQVSRNLTPDGLYGKYTSKKLRKAIKYKVIRSIIKEARAEELTKEQIAYILATVKHETANTWLPITEYGSKNYISKRYDPILGSTLKRRVRAKKMGNTKRGDGWRYRGRGFIQITWKKNYEKFSILLSQRFNKNIDLVKRPKLALELNYAVFILVYGMKHGVFTGKKLSKYINSTKIDFRGARRTVNGNDKAIKISRYAQAILKNIDGLV